MNWKRLLLIGLVAGGFAFASAPRSNAGVSVGIGFGFPGYYGYGYPGYYGYAIIPIIGRTLTITTGGLHSIGPEAIDITATIVTITIGIKDDVGRNPLSWLVIRASSFFCKTGLAGPPFLSIPWG